MQPQERTVDLSQAMKGFSSSLSQAEIDRSIRQVSSMNTMMFAWHCAGDISNLATNKIRNGTKYVRLPRLTLLPIYPWKVPVIKAKNASFSIGRMSVHGGASLGPTGVDVSQRVMLAHETRQLWEKWYGAYGFGILDALTTEEDIGKAEAFLLYEAIMKTTREVTVDDQPVRTTPGVKCIIEDLPKFLEIEAPILLEKALAEGVQFAGSDFFPGFPPGAYQFSKDRLAMVESKGEEFITNMKTSVEKTTDYVLNDETGILVISRQQLQLAAAHVSGSKARLDKRDEFYSGQFPSFSFDTAVERAQRANEGVISTIRESGAAAGGQQVAILTQLAQSNANQSAILEELRASRAEQARLADELDGLKKKKAA